MAGFFPNSSVVVALVSSATPQMICNCPISTKIIYCNSRTWCSSMARFDFVNEVARLIEHANDLKFQHFAVTRRQKLTSSSCTGSDRYFRLERGLALLNPKPARPQFGRTEVLLVWNGLMKPTPFKTGILKRNQPRAQNVVLVKYIELERGASPEKTVKLLKILNSEKLIKGISSRIRVKSQMICFLSFLLSLQTTVVCSKRKKKGNHIIT